MSYGMLRVIVVSSTLAFCEFGRIVMGIEVKELTDIDTMYLRKYEISFF
jgi:hypothetical protein